MATAMTAFRLGQRELAALTHDGRSYTALGYTCAGDQVSGYIVRIPAGCGQDRLCLATRAGRELAQRVEWIHRYPGLDRDPRYMTLIHLPHGRVVVGVTLDAGLFRGRLLPDRYQVENEDDWLEVEAEMMAECDYWDQRDEEGI